MILPNFSMQLFYLFFIYSAYIYIMIYILFILRIETYSKKDSGKTNVTGTIVYNCLWQTKFVRKLTHLCPPFQHLLSERLRLSA